MHRFDSTLTFVLIHEGGFTVDHAGPTLAGVTQGTYDRARRRWGLPLQSVRKSTPEERTRLYREDFWELEASWRGGKRFGCDALPPPADLAVFDAAVNSGVGWGVKFLQRAIGERDDGWFGPATLRSVEPWRARGVALAARVTAERMRYVVRAMRRNASLRAYNDGWINRWADVLTEASS